MSRYQLGAPVKFTRVLWRNKSDSPHGLASVPHRFRTADARHRWDTRAQAGAGVIVGRRTLSNGVAWWGYEEGTTYGATDHFEAWLVAYDLNRRPVLVLPEHLEPTVVLA